MPSPRPISTQNNHGKDEGSYPCLSLASGNEPDSRRTGHPQSPRDDDLELDGFKECPNFRRISKLLAFKDLI